MSEEEWKWVGAIGQLIGGDGRALAELLLSGRDIPKGAREKLAELVNPSKPPVFRVKLVAKRVEWLTSQKEMRRGIEIEAAMQFIHFREDCGMSRYEAAKAARRFVRSPVNLPEGKGGRGARPRKDGEKGRSLLVSPSAQVGLQSPP